MDKFIFLVTERLLLDRRSVRVKAWANKRHQTANNSEAGSDAPVCSHEW